MAGNRETYKKAINAAKNFARHADWTNALKAYRTAAQEFPSDETALLGLADAYFELQQFQSTVRALQHILKTHPTHQAALDKMAAVFSHLGRDDQAAKTYIYAGNLQAKQGMLEQAAGNWQRALEIDPNQTQARNNLAHALLRLGETDLAVTELIELAAIFQEKAAPEKARQYLQGAMKLMPNAPHVLAAQKALENGTPIRDTQSSIAAEVAPDAIRPAPSAADEALLSFAALDTSDDDAPGNPREAVESLALEELAGVLFEESLPDLPADADKSTVDMRISQAIDLQTRGDVDGAIAAFEELLELGFRRPAVYFLLANLYANAGKCDEAIGYLNRARTHKAYLQGINYTLGECYRQENDLKNALRHFVEVLRLIDMNQSQREGTRELTMTYQHLVDSFSESDDTQRVGALVGALARFLSTKNYEQKILDARRHLGNGDGSSVNAWVEFLEAANPEDILSAMADTADLMQRKMYMTAIEACYRAIEKSPFYLPLHLRLAEIYRRQDAVENSIRKYLAVAEVYQARGQMYRVEEIYHQVLKVAPMDLTVRQKLVELYISRGEVDSALEQYQILADVHYQLAQIEQALQVYQSALQIAEQASDPVYWKTSFLRHTADIYMQRVEWSNALKVYEQLVKLVPDDEEGIQSLIDLYFKLNQKTRALALLNRMEALFKQQQRPEAWHAFLQQMIDRRPREMILRQKMAAHLAETGKRQEAIEQYDLLGELQLEAGLRDDAVRTIKQILQLEPDNPDGYRQLLQKIETDI